MPKKWFEKKLEIFFKKCWKSSKKRKNSTKTPIFNIFLQIFLIFFSTHFFGIFELRWQCSKFWLRWINFIFSKWLSYSRFTKSVLPSSQVENVRAYHPSTIYVCLPLENKVTMKSHRTNGASLHIKMSVCHSVPYFE